MPKKRKSNSLQIKKRFLILCEGKETEPNYFKGIKHDKHSRNRLAALRIEIFDSAKNTGKELVAEAKDEIRKARKEGNSYESVWVVIDKDGYTKHPQTFDQASANKINICFSSISFEYWFLLHFEYSTKAYEKADYLISKLKKNNLPCYNKNDDNYRRIKDKTKTAIRHAERVRQYWASCEDGKKIYERGAYTDVDILVKQLLEL